MLQTWQVACRAARRGFADPRLVALATVAVMAVVLAVRGDEPAKAEIQQHEMLGALVVPMVPTTLESVPSGETVKLADQETAVTPALAPSTAAVADVRATEAAPTPALAPTSNPGLYAGGTGEKLATVAWWEKMAHCETGTNWSDGGQWAGGLGIYIGTWKAWGGLEFAKTPGAATKDEQIIVANRIASQGWMQPNGELKDPVWYRGWGGLHCAGNPREVSLTNTRAYTPAQLAMPVVVTLPPAATK